VKRSRLSFLVAALVVLAGIAAGPFLFDRLDSSLDPAPRATPPSLTS
jgi:hypothetical protein